MELRPSPWIGLMSFIFLSPYLSPEQPARWLRGNHHGHTTLSDGADTPEATISAYEAAGYDYLAMSEHDRFCDPGLYQRLTRMTLLPAAEVTSHEQQTLMYLGASADLPKKGTLSFEGVLAFVRKRGGLFICDHPNWIHLPGKLHAPVETLLTVDGLAAIEIYTGVVERMLGSAYSLDVWDRLLSAGRLIFGHATDDQHAPIDRFLGWNLVQWPKDIAPTAAGIIAALAAGRFIASTGVTVDTVGVSEDGKTISISSNADELRWIISGGVVAQVTSGGTGTLSIDEFPRLKERAFYHFGEPSSQYVRVECLRGTHARAWTQPFLIQASR